MRANISGETTIYFTFSSGSCIDVAQYVPGPRIFRNARPVLWWSGSAALQECAFIAMSSFVFFLVCEGLKAVNIDPEPDSP